MKLEVRMAFDEPILKIGFDEAPLDRRQPCKVELARDWRQKGRCPCTFNFKSIKCPCIFKFKSIKCVILTPTIPPETTEKKVKRHKSISQY